MKVSENEDILWLRARVANLEREVANITRHNLELRETVKALLEPTKAPVDTMGGRFG